MVPPIGAGVWVEFEQGDPDHPIWVGCRWGFAADVPPLALVPPAIPPRTSAADAWQNTLLISDLPPTPLTGGIMLKSTTGATIIVNDAGIFIQNGKGASITMTGPDGRRQPRRPDGHLRRTEDCMPGPVLHLGATVLCAHGGQATPTAPVPRVLVSAQPVATIAAPYAIAGCAFPPAAGGPASPASGSSARRACSRWASRWRSRPASPSAPRPERRCCRPSRSRASSRPEGRGRAMNIAFPTASITAAARPTPATSSTCAT